MMNENDLMSRLVASKAIMDSPKFSKSSNSMNGGLPPTSLQDFDMPQARYNIPQEFLQESQPVNQPYLSSLPKENTKPVGVPSVDAIKSSKLPDEIKKLMLEHPIAQPNQQTQVTLSDDLIERASRLMGNNNSEKTKIQETQNTKSQTSDINYKLIQKMIEEAVNKALKENGLLVESETRSSDQFKFRVGQHLFEGKVNKVKKINQIYCKLYSFRYLQKK
jgi:hypothetical protein